jgi:hypothetical protein
MVWATTNSELHTPLPSPAAPLSDWWPAVVQQQPVGQRKMANSFISLVIRSLWLERNAHVFDNIETSPLELGRQIREEWHLWLSCRGLGRP